MSRQGSKTLAREHGGALLHRRLRPYAIIALLSVLAIAPSLQPMAARAASDKLLQRLKGVVGYQAADGAPLTLVVARLSLPDDYLAVTRTRAAALLALPDSSLVSLGENTRVQVGAFNRTADGPGATITVNGGTLRFDIRRPKGATANYHFATPTTQVAVRGTIGLISLAGGNTTIACLVCAADSITVTVGTQTFTILTGQLLSVSATGAVVSGALSTSVLGTFSSAGVSTSTATGTAAATAGVTSAAGASTSGVAGAAAAGTTGATTAAAAGAAVAAGGVAAAVSNAAAPTPQPTPSAVFSVSAGARSRR